MRKLIGITLGLALTAAAVGVSAEEVTGKIKSIDMKGSAIVLEDGTSITVDSTTIAGLTEGELVRAMYQTVEGKKMATDFERRTGTGADDSTNFGSRVNAAN